MATGTELCSGALRACSSLAPGEGIPGTEADYALTVLNGMLAAWSADNLMPPCRTLESFSLPAGVSSRTVGPGAQLDTTRPDDVTDAFTRDAGNNDRPVDVTMTSAAYNALALKTSIGRPARLFYDPQYPNGMIYLDRQTDQAYTLFLESFKPFTRLSSLATTVYLPGEYEEGIKYLLAERLAPEYGMAISADLRKLITDAEKRLLRKNVRPVVAQFDPAVTPRTGYYDITAG